MPCHTPLQRRQGPPGPPTEFATHHSELECRVPLDDPICLVCLFGDEAYFVCSAEKGEPLKCSANAHTRIGEATPTSREEDQSRCSADVCRNRASHSVLGRCSFQMRSLSVFGRCSFQKVKPLNAWHTLISKKGASWCSTDAHFDRWSLLVLHRSSFQ